MLIKEYRIPLPLSVEEYRIAQLYMIAKKSREESKDVESGIEILVNEPYENGPGPAGVGQYTRKIYHVGNHLPGWFKSLLPKSALSVEEEAWNAYPYTKTRYKSPFVEKFFLEIETVYCADCGSQENVFNLSPAEMRSRVVDVIDVVKDENAAEYYQDEDPTVYTSRKTGRGPLTHDWLLNYSSSKGRGDIMCAYKLCRVEFRYWGMQTKLEKYIHDVALRKTMLRAHRQAWVWQDEWFGLTMEDIRQIEIETQRELQRKMAVAVVTSFSASSGTSQAPPDEENQDVRDGEGDIELDRSESRSKSKKISSLRLGGHREEENVGISGQGGSFGSVSRRMWRMDSIVQDSDSESSSSGANDEFFDCQEDVSWDQSSKLIKWSSLDLLTEEDPDKDSEDSIFSMGYLKRTASERGGHGVAFSSGHLLPTAASQHSIASSDGALRSAAAVGAADSPVCKVTTLILVAHAGSVLDTNSDFIAKKSDILTFRTSFENVIRQHYGTMMGRIVIKLISCPSITANSLGILSSLSPYSFDVSPSYLDYCLPHVTHDSVPIGVIPVLSTVSAQYAEHLAKFVKSANKVYNDFVKSPQGVGFKGIISLIGDSMGSILAYDALCSSQESHQGGKSRVTASASEGTPRRTSTSSEERYGSEGAKLDFQVRDLFMFGSPISLVLAYRKMKGDKKEVGAKRPAVHQVYNLFHATDPVASRLEPLISARFSMLPPVNIPRYQKYPLGNGQPYHLLEVLQTNAQIFSESCSPGAVTAVSASVSNSMQMRRLSEASLFSNSSGLATSVEPLPVQLVNSLSEKWWGIKRLDYALYCPDGLANFPTNALPHLFHASYWESCDVIAFILRQLGNFDLVPCEGSRGEEQDLGPGFVPSQPREKWIRKRTSVKLSKLRNIGCNHRANDVIVKEGAPQTLVARFMYGSYDVITLTGEKVDIHVMNDDGSVNGEWIYLSTQVTDKTGRITYTIPEEKVLSYGIHHVKMVVRGDHTCVDFQLAVVPPKTECVVFSIDGSFTASVSVTGRDPKVRAGAVDVVRQWQELGYLIVYISARPDMQQQLVLSWLAQHNFPYGLVVFADRFSTDPLGYKTSYLRSLTQEHGAIICAAYGSNKDIAVYSALGLKPHQIFIVGRVSKKYQCQATILCDGYAAHLTALLSHGGCRAAQGNARMVLFPRGCFGHNASIRRRRSAAKRTTSTPPAFTYA